MFEYFVGQHIRYTYLIVPRSQGWEYARVVGHSIENGFYATWLQHRGYLAAVNLSAVAHHEPCAMPEGK